MSSRIDPNLPSFLPPAVLPSISENPPDAITASADTADTAADTPTAPARNPAPPGHVITRFAVKPSSEEAEGVGTSSVEGRGNGAYWKGGVAAHYKWLEDGYM